MSPFCRSACSFLSACSCCRSAFRFLACSPVCFLACRPACPGLEGCSVYPLLVGFPCRGFVDRTLARFPIDRRRRDPHAAGFLACSRFGFHPCLCLAGCCPLLPLPSRSVYFPTDYSARHRPGRAKMLLRPGRSLLT